MGIRLLANPDYSAKTRHGFARGGETLFFVNYVRNYYNVLRWIAPEDSDDAGWMKPRVSPPIRADLAPDSEKLAARQNSADRRT